MELSLKEKFVILAFEPQKGNNLASTRIAYGIAGAMLFELAAQKKIEIRNGRVHLIDSHRTNDALLDKLIEILAKPKKQYKVRTILQKVNLKAGQYKKPIIESLIRSRHLRQEKKSFLFIPYKVYPSSNPGYRKELVSQIRMLVLRKNSDHPDIPLLTGLAGACKLAPAFFRTKEEKKIAAKRIKEIVKESQVDTAIDETIRAVQAAVMVAVITPVITSSS